MHRDYHVCSLGPYDYVIYLPLSLFGLDVWCMVAATLPTRVYKDTSKIVHTKFVFKWKNYYLQNGDGLEL